MNRSIEYVFTVDSLLPETAPMLRVAQYFIELSKLLGQAGHVHFHNVTKGSLKCHALADFEAVPRIKTRIKGIGAPDSDVTQIYEKLNAMLAKDQCH